MKRGRLSRTTAARRPGWLLLLVVVAALAAVSAGCGGGDEEEEAAPAVDTVAAADTISTDLNRPRSVSSRGLSLAPPSIRATICPPPRG